MASELIVKDKESSNIPQSLLSQENFTHYMKVAEFLAKSSMVPKALAGKPADILIAMEMGQQIGLPMMQALQDIGVINGRPTLWGDGLMALARGHKDFEWIQENNLPTGAECIIKRKGSEPHRVFFSIDDAKKAGLWGKSGPWTQYPTRMLQMRARSFCIRDTFADALKGIKCEEEVSDYTTYEKHENPKIEELRQVLIGAPSQNHSVTITSAADSGSVNATLPPLQVHNTGSDDIPASFEQIEQIDAMMKEQEFTPERRKKAFDYFKIQDLPDLTEAQAIVFLMQLGK